MAVIDDLVARIEDQELKSRIQTELSKIDKQKKFGLVFENHLPECTPLYEIPVVPGRDVAQRIGPINEIWTVLQINGDIAICRRKNGKTVQEFPIDELVSVASFGDPIYPYLKPLDSVCNAPESDLWHTIIEADNYHALQLLEYLYADRVDCIYIDPPYNTGAKDWKYNNNYVDANDAYRHSKWLSFMERRLKLAKKLLNRNKSVLIITIDEKEQSRLGCLLDEIFSGCSIQMVTAVINPKGSVRDKRFTRCDEYIYFVFMGEGACIACESDYLNNDHKKESVRWPYLKRTGTNSRRASYKSNAFYPIYYEIKSGKFHSVGESLDQTTPRNTVSSPDGCVAVWPIDDKGEERIWQLAPDTLKDLASIGYIDFGELRNGTAAIKYVSTGLRAQIETGEIVITGKDNNGVVKLEYASGQKKEAPKTVWNKTLHSASEHGSNLLMEIFGKKVFTYPKSLYAVKDTLDAIIGNNKTALVVDFFAGSGTTLHAINLLNTLDNGKRRCILVTNNEVSADESSLLLKKGILPGQDKWNELGIARHVTWPRTFCSIKGIDINGKPLKGEYLDCGHLKKNGFKSNVAFFQLGFLDKKNVSIGRQLKELLSILWLKAGAHGPCPSLNDINLLPKMLICQNNRMAILLDSSYFADFRSKLNSYKEIDTVFIVTDNERSYQFMISELDIMNSYQLYRDYLDNFRINQSRV